MRGGGAGDGDHQPGVVLELAVPEKHPAGDVGAHGGTPTGGPRRRRPAAAPGSVPGRVRAATRSTSAARVPACTFAAISPGRSRVVGHQERKRVGPGAERSCA